MMDMENLQELLSKINRIVVQEKTIQQEAWKRGEKFNVFSILNLSRDETRLHSAFIAHLLSQDGSHGLKDLFLRSFIQEMIPGFSFNSIKSKVKLEHYIGPINTEKKRGGRIDIMITDDQHHAIIIENKIDASEQSEQLERYNNFAKDAHFQDYRLLFFTPEGKESDTIEDKNRYIPISYRNHILPWLEKCVGIAACHPLVREIIRQYIINLSEILNIMSTDSANKLIEVSTSKEYLDSTLAILENKDEIEKAIRKQFVNQLEELAKKKELDFHCDDNLCELRSGQWITMEKTSLSQTWKIYIGWNNHTQSDGARYGISRELTENTPALTDDIKNALPYLWTEGAQDNKFPCGWSYFRGKEGRWWDWKPSK